MKFEEEVSVGLPRLETAFERHVKVDLGPLEVLCDSWNQEMLAAAS